MGRYKKPDVAGIPVLKELAKKDGGLVKLARAIGVTQTSVSHYANGKHYPEIPILMAIADYYGVTVDYLLGRGATKPTQEAIQRAEARGYAAGLRLASRACEDLAVRLDNISQDVANKGKR